MKDYEKMTYPQQGAYGVFYRRIISPKMLRPIRKTMLFSSLAIILIGNTAWIFWTGFWWSLLGIAVAIALLCFLYNKFYRVILRSADELFNSKIKDSLYWQNYYFSSTIRQYEKMKEEYSRITIALEPIPNVGEPGILNITLQDSKATAYLFNKANEVHLAMFKYTFQEVEAEYKKVMQYLSENNLTLPLLNPR